MVFSDIYDYVVHVQEDLKETKLRAREEAEDLAQEMAELRYQISNLLEEECKRRACIEQASLRRIAELEAQVFDEFLNFFCRMFVLCSMLGNYSILHVY